MTNADADLSVAEVDQQCRSNTHNDDQASAQSAVDTTLELGSATYICAWLGIVALHGVCAWYLTQLARVCWFIKHPYLDYLARLATGDQVIYLHHASIVIGLVAALHYWQLLCIFWATLRAREFAFPDHSSSEAWKAVSQVKVAQSGTRRLTSLTALHRFKKIGLMPRIASQSWQFVFGRRGLLGVESRFFHVVFTLRELVEIVSQTFQAKRSAELLSRRWLNNLFVALVVVNCWSTPVLQHMFRRHQGKERIACLLLDALLNMGSSMVVPLAVFWPYYQTLDPETFSFPLELLYNEVWFARFTMETRLLFSISTADALSKLVPHVAIYSSLTSVATLIHRRNARRRQARVVVSADVTSDRPSSSHETAVRQGTSSPRADAVLDRRACSERCKQVAMHLFFFAWGLVLLVLHLHAVMRFSDNVLGCRQATGAWFATDYPCSMYTYNCYRQGTSSPDENSWTHLDKETLVSLTIAHCPELRIPRALQSFSNLLGFHLHNATLVEWSKESAISASKHTKLVVLLFTRINMTQLPDGILEPLPPSLIDIEFAYTSLTALPADLHERWHPIRTMYIEHSLLTEFPTQLFALGISDLSLYGNYIERMPTLPAGAYFYAFGLSNNPLKELPDNIGSGTMISFLALENTQLEVLPTWTRTSIENAVYLHYTPYCAAQNQEDVGNAHLTCLKRGEFADGNVPISLMDRLTPL